jgi:hypothetical protein
MMEAEDGVMQPQAKGWQAEPAQEIKKETWNGFSPGALSQSAWPGRHLDFGLLASRAGGLLL